MALTDDNKIVHGLWIGNELSPLEILTVLSFVHHGHHFHLWLYEPLNVTFPKNVILQDANTIIPLNQVYRKKNNDPVYNIGKGSFGSPFSDLFRYKLLHKHGGWWTDMDITCLKPLQIDSPYFFRPHPILPVIGNLIKVPANSELMESTYNECLGSCDENTSEWLLPNKILNKHILNLGLKKHVQNNFSEIDWWQNIEPLIKKNIKLPKEWYFIHWMNEEWRAKKISKYEFYEESTIHELMNYYSVPNTKTKHLSLLQRMTKYFSK